MATAQTCQACTQSIASNDIPEHVLLHLCQLSQLYQLRPPTGANLNHLRISDSNSYIEEIDPARETNSTNRSSATSRISLRCPSCEHAPFRRRQELVKHFARHYKIVNKCDTCQKDFEQASKYIYHRCPGAGRSLELEKSRWRSLRKAVGEALEWACAIARSRRDLRTQQAEPRGEGMSSFGQDSTDGVMRDLWMAAPDNLRIGAAVEPDSSTGNPAPVTPQPLQSQIQETGQANDAVLNDNQPSTAYHVDHSATWCVSSSEAPTIWDDWNWGGSLGC